MKAWTLDTPSPRLIMLALGSVPLVAVVMILVATRDGVPFSIHEAIGLGLVVVAYQACFRWIGVGRLPLATDLRPVLGRSLIAIVIGMGVAWLGSLAVPELSLALGAAGVALVGLCLAGILLGVWSVSAVVMEPRSALGRVLVLGREDLARKLCADLLDGQLLRHSGTLCLEPVAGHNVDAAHLRQLVQQQNVTRIVVAEPRAEARDELTSALLECRLLGVEVEDAVELYQKLHGKLWLEALEPGRLVFSEGFRITPSYVRLKRLLDVVCAIALLVLAAPLWALIAVLIKLESRGPVLFRQERVGQFGRDFVLFKFRSMREDAEAGGPIWARQNDDRATRVGRLLRRLHLDEIPQALNVLRGDLSFVGPRPERPCFVKVLRRQIGYYDLRLYMKPGITGWAQVCYPYADSIEDSYEKLQYDLYYARRVSLGLDVRILFRTAMHVLRARGR